MLDQYYIKKYEKVEFFLSIKSDRNIDASDKNYDIIKIKI